MENLYFVLKELKVNTAFAVQGFPKFLKQLLTLLFSNLVSQFINPIKKIKSGFFDLTFYCKRKTGSNQTKHGTQKKI